MAAAQRCQKCGSIYPSADQHCPMCGGDGLALFDRPTSPKDQPQTFEDTTTTLADRSAIREMLEDGFRSMMLFQKNYLDMHPYSTPQESQAAGDEFFKRWCGQLDTLADLMPPEQRATFIEIADEESAFLMRELERSPLALAQRLGVAMGASAPQVVYRRQSMGEMAVRTAVRATIWQLIRSLFRW